MADSKIFDRILKLGLGFVVAAIGCSEPAPQRVSPPKTTAFPHPRPTALDSALALASTVEGRDTLANLLSTRGDLVVAALKRVGHPDDVALGVRLLVQASGEEKLTFARWLIDQGGRSVGPVSVLVATSDDVQTIVQGLQTLGKLGSKEALPVIRTRLGDREAWIRMAAAHAFGEIGGVGVVEALNELLRDREATVVAAAVIAIGRTGDPMGLASCLDALDHTHPRVRGAAASAVGRLGSEAHAHDLHPLLEDTDAGVRYKASRAIEHLAAD